jgi:hypothetical protein
MLFKIIYCVFKHVLNVWYFSGSQKLVHFLLGMFNNFVRLYPIKEPVFESFNIKEDEIDI